MKILKEGKIPPPPQPIFQSPRFYIKTCDNCQTEFEFNKQEMRKKQDRNYMDGDFYVITCPFCETEILHPERDAKLEVRL